MPFYRNVLNALTSLKLTIICLCLAIALVFVGTIAQVDMGLYQTQKVFFHSFFVFWSPPGVNWGVPVFPGGYFLGGVLMLNLVAAHVRRFSWKKGKIGIWLVHFGLMVLMSGQFATELLQVESLMRIREGETLNYSESPNLCELVLFDVSSSETNRIVALSGKSLVSGMERHDLPLPFTIHIREYHANCEIWKRTEAETEQADPLLRGTGKIAHLKAIPLTIKMDERNVPGAYVDVKRGGIVLGRWLVSPYLGEPQQFEIEGRRYEIALLFIRYYKDFSLQLLDFRHEKYLGTNIPKNYSSRVLLRNPQKGEEREVLIRMNNPLRYGGETLYQAGYDERDPHVTVLQVVRNPTWLGPYVSSTMIGLGLIVQFLGSLVSHIRRKL